MADAKKEFWDRLSKVQAGMLGFSDNDTAVPMSPNLRDNPDGKVWFITAQGTDLVDGLAGGDKPGRLMVADKDSGLYANVTGTLSLSHDSDVLDEIWSPIASAWFEEDRKDPDLRLVCFTPEKGDAWFSTTSGAKFLYEIAKANITQTQPDTGWQAELSF